MFQEYPNRSSKNISTDYWEDFQICGVIEIKYKNTLEKAVIQKDM